MKNNLFFDIQLGVSGDMLLGSLFDIGLDKTELLKYLSKLELTNWEINPQKIQKYNVTGISANITCREEKSHRHLKDIEKIISMSSLPEIVKTNILIIFRNLGTAEARVHGMKPEEIHFHEVGATDSIIDISAFCIAIYLLNIEKIYYNEFSLGTGTIKSSHGEIPVPVPAVVELIKNQKSRITEKYGELVTPTAAAILTTLGLQTDNLNFTILNNGNGFGTRDYTFPSYTRVFLIKKKKSKEVIQQLECNIDDMNPQLYPDIINKLINEGALDAYTCNISMKKGRPGTILTVIADIQNIPKLKEIIYSNTTTLGIRSLNINREKLHRKFEEISISGNIIRIKIGYYNSKIINIQPEFEDCKSAADKLNIPLKEIINRAVYEYKSIFSNSTE